MKEKKEKTSNICKHIQQVQHLTREMLALADEGDRDRRDDSCGIVYGVLRDSAYRLRKHLSGDCQDICPSPKPLDSSNSRR